MSLRSEVIQIRLSPAEKRAVQKSAEKEGKSVSAYLLGRHRDSSEKGSQGGMGTPPSGTQVPVEAAVKKVENEIQARKEDSERVKGLIGGNPPKPMELAQKLDCAPNTAARHIADGSWRELLRKAENG